MNNISIQKQQVRDLKNISIVVFFILLHSFSSQAQFSLGADRGKGIDINTHALGFITEIPMASHRTVGSSYLYEQWVPSMLDFGKNGTVEGLYIRYDIMNYVFDIRLSDKVKTIDGRYIEKFTVKDSLGNGHQYVNCNQFKSGSMQMIGFFEILSEGKYRLLKKTEIIIIESNYVQALDLGEKDDEISQKSFFYIARDEEVTKVPSSRKLMAEAYPEIEGLAHFLKSNKINLRKSADLKKVVQIMNNLES